MLTKRCFFASALLALVLLSAAACAQIDLAPYVGASLEVMKRDSRRMRGERPFVLTNIRSGEGVDEVIDWLRRNVLLEDLA